MINDLEGGPLPTADEVRAAMDRHLLWPATSPAEEPGRAVRAAGVMAARLGQLASAEPAGAAGIAEMLAVVVQTLAARHAGCTVCGCASCLYLADAGAVAQAWQDGL
jgi:hypothetical protein